MNNQHKVTTEMNTRVVQMMKSPDTDSKTTAINVLRETHN